MIEKEMAKKRTIIRTRIREQMILLKMTPVKNLATTAKERRRERETVKY